MNLFIRCLLLPLLILVINTVAACAQSSFLDELRINAGSESIADDDLPRTSAQTPGHLRGADHANASIYADRFKPTEIETEPLLNNPLFAEECTADLLRGRAELDDVTSYTGFETPCAPEFDCSCETPLIRYRTTCFQGAQTAYGVIPSGGSDGLGIQTFDLLGTFAVPFGSMDHVVSFTPFFRMDQLNANASLDVPDALYEAGVKTFWKKVVSERLTTMALFTPSVRSDFDSSQQAFKLFGMAMLQWKLIPDRLWMTGGAIYTGRQDYPVLPTMGLYWTPSPLWKLDIQFPSPRLSRRLLKDGDRSETWAYLSGVFGGNTWAVKRASGQDDQLTLRDLRLVLGVEHLLAQNRGVFVETGWVFSRSMEYDSSPGQVNFGDAILLRAGIQF